VARRKGLVISDEQMKAIDGVLSKLQNVTGSHLVALVSTSGQPITVCPPDSQSDTLSLAALAAGSFAATRQLADVLKEREFTLLFHEGTESNLHVIQVNEQILMLLTFGHETQVGLVRLYTTRALAVLKPIFERAQDADSDESLFDDDYSVAAGNAIDDLLPGREAES
jgi:predicted regulator of Ras-like GTPase activity (Roadblock/LC7/MglB family)